MPDPVSQETPKIAVVIPYFGRFGPWFPLFLESLARQDVLDLLLLTDAETPPLPANARRVSMTLEGLAELAGSKLGMQVNLPSGYKLCDLKPAYGLVFEDHLQGYDYWAFGDEDVVYGDLDRLLAPRLREWPDMVVPQNDRILGHLTVLRNIARINRLVLEEPGYAEVQADGNPWGYDETSWARDLSRPSFTRTVKRAEARGDVTINWGLPNAGNVPALGESVEYDGRRWYTGRGEELAYYHWGRLRQRNWTIPGVEAARAGFVLDHFGFHARDLGPAGRQVRRMRGRALAAARKLKGAVGAAVSSRKTGA